MLDARNSFLVLFFAIIFILIIIGVVLLSSPNSPRPAQLVSSGQTASAPVAQNQSTSLDVLQHFQSLIKVPLPTVQATTSVSAGQVPELLRDFTLKYIQPTTVVGYQSLSFVGGKTGYEEDVEKSIVSGQSTLWDFKSGQNIITKSQIPLFKPVSASIDPLSGSGVSELEISGNILDIFYYKEASSSLQFTGRIILYAK